MNMPSQFNFSTAAGPTARPIGLGRLLVLGLILLIGLPIVLLLLVIAFCVLLVGVLVAKVRRLFTRAMPRDDGRENVRVRTPSHD